MSLRNFQLKQYLPPNYQKTAMYSHCTKNDKNTLIKNTKKKKIRKTLKNFFLKKKKKLLTLDHTVGFSFFFSNLEGVFVFWRTFRGILSFCETKGLHYYFLII
jgi:hypothetical protein